MKLYEIDQQLEQCFDPETGELIMPEVFEQLNLARDEKLEGIALWLKDLKAEAEAINGEIKNLTARKRAAENRYESLKTFLKYSLNGEKLKTSKVSITYRAAQGVVIDVDEAVFRDWARERMPELLTFKEPEISKTAIKAAIEAGQEVPGAHIEEKQAIIIK